MWARLAGGSGADAVVSDPLVDGNVTGGECCIRACEFRYSDILTRYEDIQSSQLLCTCTPMVRKQDTINTL